jgi:hypothetical protein
MKCVVAIQLTPFLLASVPMSVHAAPDKVQYELQERCAKRAEEIFSNPRTEQAIYHK